MSLEVRRDMTKRAAIRNISDAVRNLKRASLTIPRDSYIDQSVVTLEQLLDLIQSIPEGDFVTPREYIDSIMAQGKDIL
jgi:hypothetical protein